MNIPASEKRTRNSITNNPAFTSLPAGAVSAQAGIKFTCRPVYRNDSVGRSSFCVGRHLASSIKFLILLYSLTSCVVMYVPPLHHIPMFTKQGEMQVAVSQKNASISYAVTPKLAVIASGSRSTRDFFISSTEKSYGHKGYQRSLDLAVGYYQVNPHASFEIFAGYGRGYCSFQYGSDRTARGSDSHFNSFSIQPNLILGSGKGKYGFSIKLAVLDFYDFKYAARFSSSRQTAIFFDPAFTYRLKTGPVSFKVQIQTSLPLDIIDDGSDYHPYRNMLLFITSLELHISDLVKGEKENE